MATHAHPVFSPSSELSSGDDKLDPQVIRLVVEAGTLPEAAIRRAAHLARSLGADLDVVGVLPPGWCTWTGLASASAELQQQLIRMKLRTETMIEVRSGSMTDVAIEIGRERPVLGIVMSPDAGGHGHAAVAVANALDVGVLVAREERPDKPILATTDMMDLQYPVLVASCELARRLGKPATFFHNDVSLEHGADWGEAVTKLERLAQLATCAGIEADAIVGQSEETLAAILRLVEMCDADLVSIGCRQRTHDNHFELCLTELLVDACSRSVVVVPLESARAA